MNFLHADFTWNGIAIGDPCADAGPYLRRRDVQLALHAIQPNESTLWWTRCAGKNITYDVRSMTTSMIPLHKKLLAAGEFGKQLTLLVFCDDVEKSSEPGQLMTANLNIISHGRQKACSCQHLYLIFDKVIHIRVTVCTWGDGMSFCRHSNLGI